LQTLVGGRYRLRVRALWAIERAVFEATAEDYPKSAKALRLLANTALVANFENTGAGFFSTIILADDAPALSEKSPLDGAYANVEGIEHGMGFIVFLTDGRVSLIEGYCHGDVSTVGLDFSRVKFDLRPWSRAAELTG
jgi:hypothetical protein